MRQPPRRCTNKLLRHFLRDRLDGRFLNARLGRSRLLRPIIRRDARRLLGHRRRLLDERCFQRWRWAPSAWTQAAEPFSDAAADTAEPGQRRPDRPPYVAEHRGNLTSSLSFHAKRTTRVERHRGITSRLSDRLQSDSLIGASVALTRAGPGLSVAALPEPPKGVSALRVTIPLAQERAAARVSLGSGATPAAPRKGRARRVLVPRSAGATAMREERIGVRRAGPPKKVASDFRTLARVAPENWPSIGFQRERCSRRIQWSTRTRKGNHHANLHRIRRNRWHLCRDGS